MSSSKIISQQEGLHMSIKSYVFVKGDIESLGLEKYDTGFIESELGAVCHVFFMRIGKFLDIDKQDIQSFDIFLTGDRFENKVCDRCYKLLNTENYFENNRLKKDNIITKRPSCRSCRKIKNGKPISSKQRLEWESKKPQNGTLFTCPICQKTTIVGISKIVLDHNHETGDVRGWICESCNTGIGRFDDRVDIISHAINWLNKDS